ncbi:prolipoprotein diacylglyceryl transferase family protein [Ruoffia tabacinasalis]
MNINGTYYHPTFLYESLWNLVGLIALLLLRPRKDFFKRGELVAFYMIWYGIGRFWIEGLRTDSLYIGPLRVSQILSLILVVIGIGLVLWIRLKGKDLVPYYTDDRSRVVRNEDE